MVPLVWIEDVVREAVGEVVADGEFVLDAESVEDGTL